MYLCKEHYKLPMIHLISKMTNTFLYLHGYYWLYTTLYLNLYMHVHVLIGVLYTNKKIMVFNPLFV